MLQQLARRLESAGFTTWGGADELVITNIAQHWMVRAIEYRRGHDHAVIMLAPICGEHAASADRVLRLAAFMGAGALAIVAGSYVVRYAIPAAQLATAPVEYIASYIHDVARTMADDLAANRPDVSSFAHYAH